MQPAGHVRVGCVGGHRGEGVAKLVAKLVELRAAAGNTDDVRAGGRQRRGDGAAEPAAGSGHDRRRADQAVGLVLKSSCWYSLSGS